MRLVSLTVLIPLVLVLLVAIVVLAFVDVAGGVRAGLWAAVGVLLLVAFVRLTAQSERDRRREERARREFDRTGRWPRGSH